MRQYFYISFCIMLSAIFLFVPVVIAAENTEGLVGYWKFDETSADTFVDSSASENNGTGVGALGTNNTPQPSTSVPTTTFANIRSLDFDGTDDYVSVANPFTGNDFTISLWVHPDVINTGGYQGFIGHEGSAGGWTYRAPGMWIGTADGALHYDSYNTAGTRYTNDVTGIFTSADTWVHIVWVKNGSEYDIYKDGVLVVDGDSAPANLYIGGTDYNIGRVDNYIDGKLDDVRIYDRALTQSEVTNLANGGYPQLPGDPVPEFSDIMYIVTLLCGIGCVAYYSQRTYSYT